MGNALARGSRADVRRNHSNPTSRASVGSTEGAHCTSGRAPSRRWPGSQGGASEVVPSLNGNPKGAPPRAAPHAHDEVRRDRAAAARHAGRKGCGTCARVSARGRSADELEPSWAHWLPQQPTQ